MFDNDTKHYLYRVYLKFLYKLQERFQVKTKYKFHINTFETEWFLSLIERLNSRINTLTM